MSEYENKTVEELIDLLEDKDETIAELEQANCDQSDEISCLEGELADLVPDEDREVTAEKAFYAGYNYYMEAFTSGIAIDTSPLKAWLDYKIGERL